MRLFKSVITALAVVAVRATIVPNSHVLHEKRTVSSSQWVESSEPPPELTLTVRIGLKPRNAELGHDHLMEISNPTSPNFGKHWTPAEVREFFSPAPETLESVQEWLSSSEIATHRHRLAFSRGTIQFNATVEELESLLKTKYKVWRNVDTGVLSLSCDEYYVPRHVGHHIDFITPTIDMGTPYSQTSKRQKRTRFSPIRHPLPSTLQGDANNLNTCNESITPACVRALYQIPESTVTQAGNNLGIYEAGDQYDQADLDSFFSQYSSNIPNGTHPILNSIDGGVAPVPVGEAGGESMLDFSIAYPLLYPQNITLFQVYDDYTAAETYGIFNQFLDALDGSYCTYDGGDDPKIDPKFPDGTGWNQSAECGIYQPTNVISVSYAVAEATYPAAYATRQCHEYMKLGLQGVSVIFASGDNGTLARFGVDGCLSNGAQNPNFPASCPYVTSVGATQIKPNGTVNDPEIAVIPFDAHDFYDEPEFTSGGGFSNIFPRPDYQDTAVPNYLETNTQLPASSTYNQSGRGFPDVSANGLNFPVYVFGDASVESGTSASTPLFASIITRLNGERIAAGKGPIGFLNQVLYANPGMFNDITEGYNWGCNASMGFEAQQGWDPVTGLGTPNYPKMLDVFLSLP
ncbi:hypothetical protein UA08_01245 [Talaromyces atroroseus]|uniref:tripeptidyl-peptidase II n=1 Tax=Talaromyces atroroseus TaxID=1441469 RepID=A0A1Q5Q9K3_TALAT|nr:hypothetical protein UA08_01245 [Talaromyces atroroseus]OKL62622.1 hypothetical protein UA08_01245 [Talaromyces atroroseus]